MNMCLLDVENATEMSSEGLDNRQQKEKNIEEDERNKANSSTCKPVAATKPKVYFPSERINARIQYMRDHALIGKFIGIWPTERALRS